MLFRSGGRQGVPVGLADLVQGGHPLVQALHREGGVFGGENSSPAVTPLPKGEALAKPQALRFARKLWCTANASLRERGGISQR